MTRHYGLSSRMDATGISHPSGSRGATRYYAEPSIPLPSGSIRSPVPALKSFDLAQAVFDGFAAVFIGLFLAALFGSVPLAIGLMILGVGF